MSKRTVLAVAVLTLTGALAAAAAPPNPLTLKQAIEMALRNNGQLAVARVRADVAERQTRVSRSAFLPNIYTGSGAAYTYGFPALPGGAAPSVFNLSYVQRIFDPPLKGKVKAEQDRTQAQRIAIDSVRDQVIERVATDYLELNEVRHSLELLRHERESAKKVLDITKERVQAGLELPINQTQAELAGAKIEQRVITLEGRNDVLEADLRTAVGLPEGMPLDLTAAKLPPPSDLPTAQLLTLALSYSPTLRQDKMERQARLAELKGQRGGYWPTVDLVGQYMILSKFNNYDEYYRTFQRNSLNVGVQVQIPIFRSRTSAAIALANSQFRESQLDVDNRRHALEIQVKKEAREGRVQDAAREVARLELKLAQEKLQMSQAQYNQGRATLAAVEQARLDESEKWLNYLQTVFNAQKAQLQLMKTTGQLTQLLQ
jgi:outer membrane protein